MAGSCTTLVRRGAAVLSAALAALSLGGMALSSRAQAPGDGPAETSAGWRKYEGNPVLGGKLGTCFDVALHKEGET